MKGDNLGELEELVLLAVRSLPDAYGVSVQQRIETVASRSVTLGAVYSALDRLQRKGYLCSRMIAGEPLRGGRRKRVFAVTGDGQRAAEDARHAREALWRSANEGGSPGSSR